MTAARYASTPRHLSASCKRSWTIAAIAGSRVAAATASGWSDRAKSSCSVMAGAGSGVGRSSRGGTPPSRAATSAAVAQAPGSTSPLDAKQYSRRAASTLPDRGGGVIRRKYLSRFAFEPPSTLYLGSSIWTPWSRKNSANVRSVKSRTYPPPIPRTVSIARNSSVETAGVLMHLGPCRWRDSSHRSGGEAALRYGLR